MDLIFGDYRLRLRERELVGPTGAVELSAPAFDLLQALLARPDTLLDKDALFAAAWPGVIVEDNTLQVHISALRKALGPGLIATVHGRGYRYTGPPPREAGELAAPAGRTPGNIDRFRADCVARDKEAEAVRGLVQQHRLVSLVGPGGVGKTTLAVDVVVRLDRPPGGTWMIDLAAIDSGAFIESTLIQTLALPFRAGSDALRTVIEHLRRADTLLVFDNCEHVITDAARVIKALLAEVQGLRVLATSQVPLGLGEERVYKLLPFGLNAAEGSTAASASFLSYCLGMFGEELTPEELPIVAKLCARLDGVALAIKMAAARASTIGLAAVDRQLEAQLAGLDAGWSTALERHRSLAASMAWSYDLLEPEDQRTLRSLGVFQGSFSLEAANAVAGSQSDARIAELVRRSLLVRDGADRTRYRLLDSTRRFALDRLSEAGEDAAARDRHAAFMTRHFADSVVHWENLPDDTWDATYLPDGDNLRAALAWAKARPQHEGYVELAAGTSRYFLQAGLGSEGLATIEDAYAHRGAASPETQARIGLALGEICRFNAMDIRAREALLPALDWLRTSDDKPRYYQALVLLAWVTVFFRPMGEADPLLAEIREVLPDMPVSKIKAWALNGTGVTMWSEGETEAGFARYEAGSAMHVETGNPKGRFRSAMNFAEILHRGGDTRNAIRIGEAVLPDLRREGTRLQLANQLSNIAAYRYWLDDIEGGRAAHLESEPLMPRDGSYWHVCFAQTDAERLHRDGEHANAALLLGIVDRRIHDWPDGRQATEQMQRDRLEERLVAVLGEVEFKRLLAQGETLDLADAEQLAGRGGQAARLDKSNTQG